MSIVEDNILWHLDGPSEHTGSHEHWFQGCKVDLVTIQILEIAIIVYPVLQIASVQP